MEDLSGEIELVTVERVAAACEVAVRTVQRWRDGETRCPDLARARIRARAAELRARADFQARVAKRNAKKEAARRRRSSTTAGPTSQCSGTPRS